MSDVNLKISSEKKSGTKKDVIKASAKNAVLKIKAERPLSPRPKLQNLSAGALSRLHAAPLPADTQRNDRNREYDPIGQILPKIKTENLSGTKSRRRMKNLSTASDWSMGVTRSRILSDATAVTSTA